MAPLSNLVVMGPAKQINYLQLIGSLRGTGSEVVCSLNGSDVVIRLCSDCDWIYGGLYWLRRRDIEFLTLNGSEIVSSRTAIF